MQVGTLSRTTEGPLTLCANRMFEPSTSRDGEQPRELAVLQRADEEWTIMASPAASVKCLKAGQSAGRKARQQEAVGSLFYLLMKRKRNLFCPLIIVTWRAAWSDGRTEFHG